jgi:hypothetical protein
MLCSIYKWQISRALDSGKALAGLVKHHLRRCASCREFYGAGEEMERRLKQDAAALLSSADPSLTEKVLSSLGAGGRVESRARSVVPSPQPKLKPKWWGMRPVLAAAASLTIVSISLVWVLTSRQAGMPGLGLDTALGLDAPGVYLEKALLKAESPYAAEIQGLKQTLKSKADAIQACLDLNLGESEPAK